MARAWQLWPLLASPRSLSQPLSRPAQCPVPRAAPASEHKPHNCFLRPRSQPEPGEPLTEFYSLTILTMMSASQPRLMSKYYDTEAVDTTYFMSQCFAVEASTPGSLYLRVVSSLSVSWSLEPSAHSMSTLGPDVTSPPLTS